MAARITSIASRMRGAGGWSNGTEYHFSFMDRVPLPRPRITRPPEISSTSIAALAASMGVRMKAYAIAVPTWTRLVAAATAASRTNPCWWKNSVVQTECRPRASAARAAST